MNGSVGQYPFGLGIFGGGFAVTSFPATIDTFIGYSIDIPISVTWVRGTITFRLYKNGRLIHTDTVECDIPVDYIYTTPFDYTYTYTLQAENSDDGAAYYYEIDNQYVTIQSDVCILNIELMNFDMTRTILSLIHNPVVVSVQLTDILIQASPILVLSPIEPVVLANPKIEVFISVDREHVSNGVIATYTADVVQNFGNQAITAQSYSWVITDKNGVVIGSAVTNAPTLDFKYLNSDTVSYADGGVYSATVTVTINDGIEVIEVMSSNIANVIFDEVRAMIRARTNRLINLEQYLPEQYFDTDVHDLIKAYQYTLNNLYDDDNGVMRLVMDELERSTIWVQNGTSPEPLMNPVITYQDTGNLEIEELTESMRGRFIYEPETSKKISILEKISRMSDLRDPYLVDSEYLSAFAADLGYNIELGFNYADTYNDGGSNADSERTKNEIMMNIRHVIKSLPYWYKIKSTKNAFKILLYSYGLIGDIITYYSTDHKSSFIPESDALSEMNRNSGYYPTSHIGIRVYAEDSLDNLENDAKSMYKRLDNAVTVIESIKPITTVIHAISVAYEKAMVGRDAINMNVSVTVRQIIRA